MNKSVTRILGFTVLIAGMTAASVASAEGKTLTDGVFTEAQANAGAAVYDANCKSCHKAGFQNEALDSWKEIGHARCKSCHTEMKAEGAPTKCGACHPKK